MTSTRYQQLPISLSSMGRDNGSSGGGEPLISPTRTEPEARDATRLKVSSQSSGEQSGRGDDRMVKDKGYGIRREFSDQIKSIWGSIRRLLDDKPYEVRDSWGNTLWNLSKRLLTIGILLSAILFGAAGTSFPITNRTLWHKFQLNQDIQLAAFGLLNTILAYMVRDSLAHISDTLVTRWMVTENKNGATVLDFDMKDELSKPWIAISSYRTRRKQREKTVTKVSRLLICLVTGICLFLQGAGMNTVGMPKRRWWPDTRSINPDPNDDRFFFQNKTMRIANVSRMSVWDRSWSMIREGGEISWELAHIFAASSSLESLEGLYETIAKPAGWYEMGNNDKPIRSVLAVTNTSTQSVQAAVINGKATAEMWDEQRKVGKAWARRAVGWYATLKLTGILLDTVCTEVPGHTVGSWEISSDSDATIVLNIGPMTESDDNFRGATCKTSLKQVLVEIQQWIVDEQFDHERPAWSINDWGSRPYPDIIQLPETTAEAGIAHELADWFNAVFPNMQSLSANTEAANLTSIVMHLSSRIVELDRGHTSMDGLAMVVATILSNYLSTFSWNLEEIDGMTTTQGPIRWEIYGSGPRLAWQWAIVAVLGINILVQLFDVWLIFQRQAKGLWLTMGGMLVAANASERMASVTDYEGAGFVTEKGKHVRYFIREIQSNEDDDAKVTLVSDIEMETHVGSGKYTLLEEGKSYGLQDK